MSKKSQNFFFKTTNSITSAFLLFLALFFLQKPVVAGLDFSDFDPFNRNGGLREGLRELDPFNRNSLVGRYLRQGLVPPGIREYFTYLEKQASYQSLPSGLREILSPHYPRLDLSKVVYAENIDTVHGQAITVGYAIYFPRSVDFNDYSDLEWLLHEIQHSEQYVVHGGVEPFLVKYLVNGAIEIGRNFSIDIHDAINLEQEADRKMKRSLNNVWSKLQDRNQYAVVCITNKINNNLNFRYKWGTESWKSKTINANSSSWFSWRYEAGSQSSPDFHIEFDSSFSSGYQKKSYVLKRYASQEQSCSSAKDYYFKRTNGQSFNLFDATD